MRLCTSVALISMAFLWCGFESSGTHLPDAKLRQIRGNQAYYCAMAMPTTGGCTNCVSAGTMLVTYSYVYNGVTYTYSYTVPTYKKCTIYQSDEKCWVATDLTTSMCTKTTNNTCAGTATGYSDASCTSAMGSQPAGGFTCVGTYSDATSGTQTGVSCTGVTPGMF